MKLPLPYLLLGAIAVPGFAHANNLIQNGSFENFTLSPSYGFDLPDSWTFTAGDPSASLLTVDGPGTTGGSGGTAEDGSFFVAFGAPLSALDTISQTASNGPGQFILSFWVDTDFSAGSPLELTASWGSTQLLDLTAPLSAGGWNEYAFTVASSGAGTLSFSGLDDNGYTLLDNVQLKSVPDEGSGWFMTGASLLALAAFAAGARSRRPAHLPIP
ncbi:MAG TPA: hypothetical protein VGL42_10055 [Opitutaceae bacterium]|jgi:hypothetical protein